MSAMPKTETVKEGYVYFALCAPDLIKVGFSKDVLRRVENFKNGYYPQRAKLNSLEVIGCIAGSRQDEAKFHKLFSGSRDSSKSKEWFVASKDAMEIIGTINLCKVPEKTALITHKANVDVYKDVRRICGNLCISVNEFMRRAVAREIAYNETALASTRKKVSR